MAGKRLIGIDPKRTFGCRIPQPGGWVLFKLDYRPRNPVMPDVITRAEVEAFLKAIVADDVAQNIYAGLAD